MTDHHPIDVEQLLADQTRDSEPTARTFQLDADPSFAGVPVEYGAVVFAAVGVAPFQVPDARGSVEPHARLERQVCLKVGRERAGETVTVHDRTHSATGSTHSSRRSRSTLIYRFVDSALA